MISITHTLKGGAAVAATGEEVVSVAMTADNDDDIDKEGYNADPIAVAADDSPPPCAAWIGPKWDVARQLGLCVWKNLTLRLNRPTATILEIVCPLIAFVTLSVLTPRNEYFNADYTPGSRQGLISFTDLILA